MSAHREKAEVLLFQLHRPADAEKAIREALALESENGYLHSLLSHALQMQRRFDEAEVAAKQAVSYSPNDSYSLSTLGHAQCLAGQFEAGLGTYAEALRCDPSNPCLLADYAQVLLVFEQFEEAERIADRGLQLDPENLSCLNTLARCAVHFGSVTRGLGYLSRARSIAPEDPTTYLNIARAWQARGQLWKALPSLFTGLRLDPSRGSERIVLRESVELAAGPVAWYVIAVVGTLALVGAYAVSLNLGLKVFDGLWLSCVLTLLGLLYAMNRSRTLRAAAAFCTPLGRKVLVHEEIRAALLTVIAFVAAPVLAMAAAGMASQQNTTIVAWSFSVGLFAPILIWNDWSRTPWRRGGRIAALGGGTFLALGGVSFLVYPDLPPWTLWLPILATLGAAAMIYVSNLLPADSKYPHGD
jgi:tetratricopeptide (TPR) repeat protein